MRPVIFCIACLAGLHGAIRAAEAPPILLTESPEVVSAPHWPPEARSRENSYFRLRLTIGPDGRVTQAEVQDRGFAHPQLIRDASNWAKGYRFQPAKRDGVPVESSVVLPFSFISGDQKPISASFRKESEAVASLMSAGDVAGASFHAEWMLSEVVRSRSEYLALEAALAHAYARAGDLPRALVAARSATARRSTMPPWTPGEALPGNRSSNYQFDNRDHIAGLLDLTLRVAVRQGYILEALRAYAELAGLTPLAKDDPRVTLVAQLLETLHSPEALVARVSLLPATADSSTGSWHHLLHRGRFTFRLVQGEIRKVLLDCGDKSGEFSYADGLEWSVPEGWTGCSLFISGEAGTTFQIVEPAA